LAVPSGANAELNGKVTVDNGSNGIEVAPGGGLELNGELDMQNSANIIKVYGEFIIGDDANGASVGTIEIMKGGKALSMDNDTHFTGTGFTVVNYGGVAAQMIDGKEITIIGYPGKSGAVDIVGDGSKFSFNDDKYELDGTATLNGLGDQYLLNSQTMKIENGTLTVAANVIFYVKNAITIETTGGLKGVDGARIEFDGSGSAATADNFYADASDTSGSAPTAGSYTWNSGKWVKDT
jgi:hypothetical protein